MSTKPKTHTETKTEKANSFQRMLKDSRLLYRLGEKLTKAAFHRNEARRDTILARMARLQTAGFVKVP